MVAHEREVLDKQGHWYLLRIRPYRTLENKIDGAVIVLIDVDSLKRSQEQLRQQTELLNQAHEPILMWPIDGDLTYWNKAAEETYGFTHDQAVGRNPHELLMTAPPYETFREALRESGSWNGELVHTRRDGQKIIVESRMVVVVDPQGRPLVVEANRPITERKEAESILRRVADDLVTADRNKDEFLAMLAHELRNPLAPLRNVVTALKSPAIGKAESDRALDIMERQIGNMARLIDDLLDVSRITLSQIELRKERVEIGPVVRRVIENIESSLRAKNQTIRAHIPAEPAYVEADVVRLEQLLGNLLHNAWKYTEAGGNIEITVGTEEPQRGKAKGEAVITVKDTGIGIDRDRLPDVFDLFMRATRSIDQRYGGLGIGLTLVRRIAELHGGRVEARSEGPGKGAEFVVRLPLIEAAAKDASLGGGASQAGKVPPRRVLVVDDNTDNVESLAMLLRGRGHTVTTANSGARALTLARSFKPDVALIDIGMPDMDGYAVARELRRSRGAVKLIALSGYGQAEARERARDAGFQEYLVKPASAEDIDGSLARLFA
jgi:two-component system, chemotaxis family, CheB/CheR fusion protein